MLKKKDFLETINALLMVIDGKDHYTMYHSLEVMDYAHAFAKELGLPRKEREVIRTAGLFHDIGKIAVPDAILNKPGRLTAEEFERIKQHPVEGAKIIGQVRFLEPVLEMVLSHHERLDGSGYPAGKKAEGLGLGTRILAIADVYSALITDRPYRPAFSRGQAGKVLLGMMEELDQSLVEVFVSRVIRERSGVS
ncbi:MAG TPA: HD-GYP domain-containing protein [bacterium]|nr:HD-GYP domain-containing protein [bacterium]